MLDSRKLKKAFLLLKLKCQEKTFQGRLKYVLQKNSSDTLVIVFSAFGPRPVYNYMLTLEKMRTADKLFILDDFGCKGSYYWFENGNDAPLCLTKALINNLLSNNGGGYKHLITVGSSKGGTCAIYFGLMFGAEHIYAAACQYYVGNYLSNKEEIMRGMMGEVSERVLNQLNRMMPEQLALHRGSSSVVHLLYSPCENTYDAHIVYLIDDLKKYSIPYEEIIEDFKDHNDVGTPFSSFLQKEFKLLVMEN